MRATCHPLLYLGLYSLRERNISKLIRYMRDLAFIVIKASSIIRGQHINHYWIWGLSHCARGTFQSLFFTWGAWPPSLSRHTTRSNIIGFRSCAIHERSVSRHIRYTMHSGIIVFRAWCVTCQEHIKAYSLSKEFGHYCIEGLLNS